MQMKCLYSTIIVALISFGIVAGIVNAEEAKQDVVSSRSVCPGRLDGFMNGVTTADQIKACLRQQPYENHNPDGRFVYMYNLKNDVKVAYLFDSSGILIKTNVYKKN